MIVARTPFTFIVHRMDDNSFMHSHITSRIRPRFNTFSYHTQTHTRWSVYACTNFVHWFIGIGIVFNANAATQRLKARCQTTNFWCYCTEMWMVGRWMLNTKQMQVTVCCVCVGSLRFLRHQTIMRTQYCAREQIKASLTSPDTFEHVLGFVYFHFSVQWNETREMVFHFHLPFRILCKQ